MSKSAVLMGIPLRAGPPRQQEQPRPSRRKPTAPRRRVPWLLLAVTVCSTLWALGILSMARRADAGNVVEVAPTPVVSIAATPVVKTPEAIVPAEMSLQDDAIPVPIPMPLLPSRPMPRSSDEPPPLVVTPEGSEPPIACKPEPKPKRIPPPTVVAAEPKRPMKEIDLTVYANCSAIGTDVLFVKDPTEAFRRAKAQKKLVYMMHLSGNLEDKEFT